MLLNAGEKTVAFITSSYQDYLENLLNFSHADKLTAYHELPTPVIKSWSQWIEIKELPVKNPQELLAVYQKSIVPIADVLLPNQFEAEKLSGMSINSEDDGWKVR